MAGPPSSGANRSTFSPKKLLNPSMMKWKESRLLPLILVAFHFSASYLLGIYHTSRDSIVATSLVSSYSPSSSSTAPCDPQQQQQPQYHQTPQTSTHATPRPTNITLDFTPHRADDDDTVLTTPTTLTFPSLIARDEGQVVEVHEPVAVVLLDWSELVLVLGVCEREGRQEGRKTRREGIHLGEKKKAPGRRVKRAPERRGCRPPLPPIHPAAATVWKKSL